MLLQVNNKNTRKRCEIRTNLTIKHQNDVNDVFWCFYRYLWTYFTHFSTVSFVDFEQVNACLKLVFLLTTLNTFLSNINKNVWETLQNIIEVLQCLQNCYLLAFNFTKNEFCLKYFWWNLLQISRTTLLPGTFKKLLWVKIKMFLFPGTENYLLAQKLSVFLVEFFLSPFCCIGNKCGNLVCNNLRIQSECEKMPTRKSLNMDTLYAVCFF